MSNIQNDIYFENLIENGFCEVCEQKITMEIADLGNTQSEYEYEAGHKKTCRYYKTSDRVAVDRLINQPNPEVKHTWTKQDEEERKIYLKDLRG
jgi:hypothetical protein